MSRTHEVLNQPPPLVDYDLAGADPLLAEATRREGAGWALDQIKDYGRTMASAEVIEWGYRGHLYGTLPPGLDLTAIIDPAIPSMLG